MRRPRPATRLPRSLLALSAVVPAALSWSTGPAAAQDTQYWSQQYGTRSELLGGAVVGSAEDLSTTFYNPGGLIFLESQSFLLSAQAMEYQRFELEAGGDAGTVDWSFQRFGAAPTLFTGTLPRDWVPGTLAYSLLTRKKLDLRVDDWSATPGDVALNSALNVHMSEFWGGLTWSQSVGDVGLGVTAYGVYRSQRMREEVLGQSIPDPSAGAVVAATDELGYWHARFLAKLGAYWERPRASFGITVTTPGVPLFGDGHAAYYRSLLPPAGGTEEPVAAALVDNETDVTYRSPLSVAAGARLRWPTAAAYATVEWFDGVDPYRVLDVAGLPREGLGSSLTGRVTDAATSVLNAAVGYQFAPWDRFTAFGSFLVDFSSYEPAEGAHHGFSTWDIYQLTSGAVFTAASADVTIGVSLAAGGEDLPTRGDLAHRTFEDVEARYRRVKAFIGFEFRN